MRTQRLPTTPTRECFAATDVSLVAVNPSPTVRRVMEITDLDREIHRPHCKPSPNEIAYFRGAPTTHRVAPFERNLAVASVAGQFLGILTR